MKVFNTISDLQNFLDTHRKNGNKIGFVPTLGALHNGHLSLIERCKELTDVCVCSIFVNPTQFNDPSDLEKYPRTVDKDAILLTEVGCDVLFTPAVSEVYPPGLETSVDVDLGDLDKVLEGRFRPGHFDGVVQVVNRLLDMVRTDYLFMGQKDFQQFTIIQEMINQLNRPEKLVVCPIVREESGLAMSSRNERLEPIKRKQASLIFRILRQISKQIAHTSLAQLKEWAIQKLSIPGFKLEYIEVVDAYTLLPITEYDNADYVVVCVAVWVEEIRLIDNLILKSPENTNQ